MKTTKILPDSPQEQHLTIRIGHDPMVIRTLPLRKIGDLYLLIFDLLGDWELIEAAGKALARLVPPSAQVLLMPDGKAQALLHVMGRETGLPTVVARKAVKSYMVEPIFSASAQSITTPNAHNLYLDAKAMAQIRGKRVAIVDDVISTGGTLAAIGRLLKQANAHESGVMAVFTEGQERPEVIALDHLPIFKAPVSHL